jgi:hypothetical protein
VHLNIDIHNLVRTQSIAFSESVCMYVHTIPMNHFWTVLVCSYIFTSQFVIRVLCRAGSCVIKQSETLQKIGLGGGHQGDQIGRIYTHWVIVYGQCFETYWSSPNFFQGNNSVWKLSKMSWATFWAIFSRTHLVTLVVTNVNRNRCFKTCVWTSKFLSLQIVKLIWFSSVSLLWQFTELQILKDYCKKYLTRQFTNC